MRQSELSEYTCGEVNRPPRVYGIDRAIVVELHGEIDLVAYQRTFPLLDAVAAGPEAVVIIDLSEVGFFDCSGISLLTRVHRRVTGRGGTMRIVCTDALTLRMLRLTHLTEVLAPAPTLRAALPTPEEE